MPSLARTLLLLFLTAMPAAAATTYQVSQSGSDSAACGQGARRTLAAGAACLAPGDTLVVGGGTYNECLSADMIPGGTSQANPTTVRNAPGETVWLFAAQPCPANEQSGGVINLEREGDYYVVIDGINVDANNTNNIGLGLVTSQAVVQNLTVKNTPRQCFQIFGPHNTVRNVTAENCGTNPATAAGAHAFYVGTTHTLIDRATMRKVNCNGLQFSLERGGVHSNTIQNSCVEGCGCSGIVLHGGNSALNNVVMGCNMGIDAWGAKVIGNTVFRNNGDMSLKGSGHEVRDNLVAGEIFDGDGDGSWSGTASNNGCGRMGGDTIACTHVLDAGRLREITERGSCPGNGPPGPPPAPPAAQRPAPRNLRFSTIP